MDAKEYIRERKRMLNAFGRTGGKCNGVSCTDCPLYRCEEGCATEKAVDIVEKWSKEHPKKTYLDVLLEAFPNTPMNNGEPVNVCPAHLGLNSPESCKDITCIDCWNREYKGESNENH